MALDQGTTSSRCIIFNQQGQIVSVAQREFSQIYPQAGWVEHDPEEIFQTQALVGHEALLSAGLSYKDIAAIGITNQRETVIIWDKTTGKPIYNAIVWQCRRTASICDSIRSHEKTIQKKTGLKIDPYFSATKVKWLLENIPYEKDNLLFGTIDTWLIWKLTKGKIHATDHTNASRTMMYNIHSCEWDDEILNILGIPKHILPEVIPSSGYVGETDIFGGNIPIAGIAGDQQAALFGQACFEPGEAKNTYGTGCFLLMNTGATPIESQHGLITTMAASYCGKIQYALEGSVFIGGAVVQWLRDELGLIATATETEEIAQSVQNTNGVYLVPAFVGLGAPHWDAYARGTMVGLTRGASKAHIVRAALESMAFQTYEIMQSMEGDAGSPMTALQVDGGASANNFLMQFQADILKLPTIRPKVTETTALGAAYLAGLAVGYWQSTDEIKHNRVIERKFTPTMENTACQKLIAGWEKAVARALKWEE